MERNQSLGRRKRQLTLQQPGLFPTSGNGRCENVSWTCPTFYSDRTHLETLRIEPMAGAAPPSPRPGRRFTRGNKKRPHTWMSKGSHRIPTMAAPVSCGLAPRADRLFLSFLLHSQCPLEHREGGGLGLAAPALRLHRLLGHELRPGEQRLLRLRASSWWPFPLAVTWPFHRRARRSA